MENHKRKFVTCDAEDRISNLPEDLINSILEHLPVQDVVRTSILSKKWRYKWTTMRVLVLDGQFCRTFAKNGAHGRNGFIRIINHIIFFHNGPISKFVLHIPNVFLDSFQEIDQWLFFLSRNGVQELNLVNSNQRYRLPSYVFSCLELRVLKLENCIFKPPHDRQGFLYLDYLSLKKIDFGANSYGTLFNLPQLSKLSLVTCTNICNFNIKATRLKHLLVATCPDAILIPLLQSECLTTVAFVAHKPTEGLPQVERTNMTRMLIYWPNIAQLFVDGYYLKFFIADKTPDERPHMVNWLWFIKVNFCDLDQLHGALYLLRNSLNLNRLNVWHAKMRRHVMHSDVPASNYLRTLDSSNQTLKELRTIRIGDVEGSTSEVLFIKFLLAQSPFLQKMMIHPSATTNVHERHNISKDVMQFPRASPKAEILFLEPRPPFSKNV